MEDSAEGPGEVGGGRVAHLTADDLDAQVRRPQKLSGLFTADKVVILQQCGICHALEAFCEINLIDKQGGGHPVEREFLDVMRFDIISSFPGCDGLRPLAIPQGFSDVCHGHFRDPIFRNTIVSSD